MGHIFEKRGAWWIDLTDETGKRRRLPLKLRADAATEDERQRAQAKAEALLVEAERKIAALKRAGGADGPLTLAKYADKWIADRRKRGIESAADDETRLKLYVLPTLGALRLQDVRPSHVRDLVRALRSTIKNTRGEALAPRTVRHIHGVLHALFHDALCDEIVPSNPVVVRRGELPQKTDKVAGWRETAIYAREEIEALISDPRLPVEHRLRTAIKFFLGLRHGEAAALTWGAIDESARPLHRIVVATSYSSRRKAVKGTKTQVTRQIPIHPTLQRALDEWKGSWERVYGRRPTGGDYIAPTATGRCQDKKDARDALLADLATLQLRHRRGHDLRRTFISLCRTDGANPDMIHELTHGRSQAILDVYTSWRWEDLCAEVAKLRVESSGTWHHSGTTSGRWRNYRGKVVTPPGFEGRVSGSEREVPGTNSTALRLVGANDGNAGERTGAEVVPVVPSPFDRVGLALAVATSRWYTTADPAVLRADLLRLLDELQDEPATAEGTPQSHLRVL